MEIVLTGGPSAGKTSAVEVLYRNYWNRLVVVPEAASILFQGGFPRSTKSSEIFQIQCQQRAIYHVQKELEALAAYTASDRALICDRGSLDGLAYWQGDEASFFESIQSTMENELSRYTWVIHLETAPPFGYKSTPIRTESDTEARGIDQKVKSAWRFHPNRIVIPSSSSFVSKIETSVKVVNMILDGASKESITDHLGFLVQVPETAVA